MGGTELTYVSSGEVNQTPQQLRRHAQHCREMAHGQSEQRIRAILQAMAGEFDGQADTIDADVFDHPLEDPLPTHTDGRPAATKWDNNKDEPAARHEAKAAKPSYAGGIDD
jgi:hypothetical protein